MALVKEDKKDPAWHIFNDQYLVRVANIETMSVEYLQHFGMPTCGIPEYDAEMRKELVYRMWTIREMVEHYEKGVAIRLVNPSDTKLIYETVMAHLNAWDDKLKHDFHTRDAPLDDLILLDKFAGIVHPHAIPFFTTDRPESALHRKMSTIMGGLNRSALLKPLQASQGTTVNAADESEKPTVQHPSMAELFANRAANNLRGPSWRNN